jgi:hypothetical protein
VSILKPADVKLPISRHFGHYGSRCSPTISTLNWHPVVETEPSDWNDLSLLLFPKHGTSMGRSLPKNSAGELVNARELDSKLLLDRRHVDRVSR